MTAVLERTAGASFAPAASSDGAVADAPIVDTGPAPATPPRIVIIGAGFAGLSAAKALRRVRSALGQGGSTGTAA